MKAPTPHHPRFVVLEGLDGTGKTTLAKRLVEHLTEQSTPAVYTNAIFSPFEEMRRSIHATGSVETSYFFYVAALEYGKTRILEHLTASWVVCDRFIHSTNAYHLARGLKRVVPSDILQLPRPDFTFLITVRDRAERDKRIMERGGNNGNGRARSEMEQEIIEEYYLSQGLTEVDNSSGVVDVALDRIIQFLDGVPH